MKSNPAPTKLRRSRPSTIVSRVQQERGPDVSTVDTNQDRIVADAAHDLRSPLTGVRELIRMVTEDADTPLRSDHSDCLATAIEQCDVMQSIIEGLLESESRPTNAPAAHRRWIKCQVLCEHVQRLIQPTLPSDADVFWDYEMIGDREVYADPNLVQRLVGNLVNNAIKAVASGTPILVRVSPDPTGTRLCWSVMDQGPGLSPAELQQVVRRSISHQGGHGLGLTICAGIAAAHHSNLEMTSIRGNGTDVSFSLPASGPSSLAETWCQWRLAHHDGSQQSKQSFGTRHLAGLGQPTSKSLARIDPADVPGNKRFTSPNRITIPSSSQGPLSREHVIAGTLAIGAAHPIAAVDSFDRYLQAQMSPFDLSLRIDARKWVWVFDTPVDQIESRLRKIVQDAEQHIRAPRLDWSDPQMISLNDRCMKARVTDILVRETLQSRVNSHAQDRDQVRLGSKPIALSPVAAARLEDELSRLTKRFKQQSVQLREHANKMLSPN